jgi:hypothetical protein
MRSLPEVETAKELMKEARKWSVMKWLREKKRLRKAADQANAALDRLSHELKQRWPENIRIAYQYLPSAMSPGKWDVRLPESSQADDAEALELAHQVRDADEAAYRARMIAEQTFDEAERKLSTTLAREGSVQAIQSWDLQEKAISLAESCLQISERQSTAASDCSPVRRPRAPSDASHR